MTTIPITLDIEVEILLSVEVSTDRNPDHDAVQAIYIEELRLLRGELKDGVVHFTHVKISGVDPQTEEIVIRDRALTTALWDSAASLALAQLSKDRP